MGKKFDAVLESVLQRSEAGGYLPGDYVKFRNGYKKCETYQHMPSTLQKEVDELATCGLNIKVVQVGDKQSGFSAGNQFKPAGCVVLTIAADHGGGRTYGRVTVTTDMVDITDGVLVPDKFKKKDVVIIKPKKLEVDPNLITNVTDKGNGKNTPTNLKLAGESKSWESTQELGMLYESMLYESMNPNMDDPKDLILHIRHARKMGDYQKVELLKNRLRTVAMRMDMLDDPDILDIIGEKFDPKQADRNKNGKLEDWEEKIGKKVFGDDETDEEDNEDCGEEEEQDACYKKVKSRYKVWPSAYGSGALVKCRKVGAKNWGNSKK